jgi:hypothetical protein
MTASYRARIFCAALSVFTIIPSRPKIRIKLGGLYGRDRAYVPAVDASIAYTSPAKDHAEKNRDYRDRAA